MSDDSSSESGAMREFDEEREKKAVKKMTEWEKGRDPLLDSLGGVPWWKRLQERGIARKNSGKKKDKLEK